MPNPDGSETREEYLKRVNSTHTVPLEERRRREAETNRSRRRTQWIAGGVVGVVICAAAIAMCSGDSSPGSYEQQCNELRQDVEDRLNNNLLPPAGSAAELVKCSKLGY